MYNRAMYLPAKNLEKTLKQILCPKTLTRTASLEAISKKKTVSHLTIDGPDLTHEMILILYPIFILLLKYDWSIQQGADQGPSRIIF